MIKSGILIKQILKFFILSVFIFIMLGSFQSVSAETVVTDEQSFINAINSNESVIIVSNDITLTRNYTISRELTIKSLENAVLSWGGASNGTMFTLNSTANFILEDISLDGKEAYVTLVRVNGATFTMNDDTVLKNIKTNSSNTAVSIGNISNPSVGGTFNMNGGLITGVMLDGAVGCYDGTINMRGSASISGNNAYGINMSNATLNMTGNASIFNNEVGQRPGVGIIASNNSVINMGLSDSDAPSIYGNTSTDNYSGAIYAIDSQLNMDFNASIFENNAQVMSGGVGLNRSTLNMRGNSKINDNTTNQGAGGGVFASQSTVNLSENASIYNNLVKANGGRGGGIFMQTATSLLTISDSASVYANQSSYGAGIYLNSETQMQMTGGIIKTNIAENDGGGIYSIGKIAIINGTVNGNNANGNGGGIYLSTNGSADISGESFIVNNSAVNGNGGGIFVEDTTDYYHLLTTGDGTVFEGNIASVAYTPPIDALQNYPNIRFNKPSIADHPLNNYDINFNNGTEILMYHVIYDSNKGTGSYIGPNIQPLHTDTVMSLSQTGISRNGYTFTEWNTEPDGSGISYSPEELIVVGSNITLYAQWRVNNFAWILLGIIFILLLIIITCIVICYETNCCCCNRD